MTAARASRLSVLLKQAAVVGDPEKMARDANRRAAIALGICAPVAIFSAIEITPLMALVSLVPVLVYFLPELSLRDKVNERREGVERELPFFSILVNVLGGAGMPLYLIFESVANTTTFSAMKREALLIRRDVDIFGQNPLESLERVAEFHPSKRFSDFLLGYTSKVRSGGDMPLYLGWRSGTLLRDLEDAWTRYAGRAGVVGSLMVTAFGVVPLLLLTVGFFAPAASLDGLIGFAALGVPALAATMIVMAGRMQPAGEDDLRGSWRTPAVISVMAGVPGLVINEVWLSVAGGLLGFLLVYGLQVRGARRRRDQVEESLPRFLGDVLEYKRQEYDLTKAIITISKKNRYSGEFDRVLQMIATSLRAGVPLDEVKARGGTRLSNLAFFVLALMARSGGGNVDTMFQLTQYTSKVQEMKASTRAEMRPYLMLSYVTPLLLVVGVVFVGAVLSNLGGTVHSPVLGTSGSGSAYNGVLQQVSNVLIVVTAAGLGLVGAKMSDFTVKNTLRGATNVLIATAAGLIVPAVSLATLLHIGV